ncbi:MAG TPA: aromatic aminobenezylarsenical efflux permease ArsG family transporter [Methanoregulaceae archaeon]|jgi:cytochrome c biogenesis protein CcdA|nr:sulfite exporter TauE/SafE family protein [Methanolinea sp.]MCC7566985.1 sulfite exporter TauE/SafE family protein [Methanoregulaceae archaeon]HOP66980.1 aromatic aminobenezylarsenical efflux permease ArsG family transporter [Methanoregulaceae archaeon]HPJ74186.1 aromatic aminobenezylarsenical efflux permease ArsG family transporter [Methanoregulaceae archaeon]HPQ75713.1 aromatic aminobenezylarsenical efflux permease ArsG family transporter [Methanoregulaceae archaeon]
MAGMEALGTSGIPLVAAFFIGLLMTFSPCPLATNITAIAFISKKIGDSRHTLLVGSLYSLGRMAAYIGLTALIVYAGLNIQAVSFFLQEYGEKLIGPFLVVMGILMLEIVDIPPIRGHGWLQKLELYLGEKGYLGGFLLGVVFALALCPFSAVLFFGMLIPIALKTGDALLVPAVFAIATALPVIIISLVLVQGVNRVSGMMSTVQKMETWIKRAVAAVFIVIGLYYIVIAYGPLIGIV